MYENHVKSLQKIYDSIISEYANDLIKLQHQYGLNCLRFRHHRANKIYDLYETKRLYIRRYFMNLEYQPMDRHKIGAVMMYAILKSKPFKINKMVPNLPNKLLMANEYLSFYVAINIVELYMIDDAINQNIDNYSEQLLLPNTYHEKNVSGFTGDVYIDNVCKALYLLKDIKHFDVFAYADILFLLEKYHDLKKNE